MKAKGWLKNWGVLLVSIHLLSGQSHGQTTAAPVVQKPSFLAPLSPKLRTPAEMDEAEAAGPSPSAEAAIPFRSTLSPEELAARKAAATAQKAGGKSSLPQEGAVSPQAPFPVLKGINFFGLNQSQSGGSLPPDTHGAVGKNQFAEIVNQRFAVYSKSASPSLLKSISLASFFGYSASPLFDPRVVYDATWNRWVVSADSFHPVGLPGVQLIFVGVSKTADATGAFWDADVDDNGEYTDFPQLGMDQDAIVMTANVFSDESFSATYVTSEVFALAKARLYNGLSGTVPLFRVGQTGTIAPPIVLDQNPKTFLAAAPPSGSELSLFALRDSSRGADATLSGPVAVAVTAYDVPPAASQPGTATTLDTLDSRFVNAGTQVEDTLWQIHTVNNGGFATPVWYKIDTETPGIFETGSLIASPTSFDFNASIVANEDGDMFVTWSSTDPTSNTFAQVRFSGKLSGDATSTLSGSVLLTCPTFYAPGVSSPERWGDYSAITVDPTDPSQAWLVNEVGKSALWGSRIGRIGF
jgi:hypothetical protein